MGIRLMLNPEMRENYVFYCPEIRFQLDLSKPGGIAPRLTSAILRGLKGKTLIDVDGVVDIEKKSVKKINLSDLEVSIPQKIEKKVKEVIEAKEEKIVEEIKEEEIVEEKIVIEEITEEVKEEEIIEEIKEEIKPIEKSKKKSKK